MRIVHVSDCYAPRLGGIETQVRELATRQAQDGHDVHVITATAAQTGPVAGRSGTELLDGVRVHRVVAGLPFDLPVHPRVVSVVRSLLVPAGAAGGADAVHVHGGVVSPFAYPAAQVGSALGLPTVVTIHGVWGPVMGPVAALADRVTRWSRWGVLLTAVSESAAAPIRAVAPQVQVQVLPNGIDVESWRTPHVPGTEGVVRVLSVMRLAPRKRGMPLLQLVSRAQERLGARRVELQVLGDGPARRMLTVYAEHLGIADQVQLLGRVGPDRVRAELARADVFLAPARRESFGIAALEARTAGVPVLGYEGTGLAEFVRDGVEGQLAADDGQLTDALVRIALDDRLRARIAEHNRTVAPAQAWSTVLPLVEHMYELAKDERAGA